MGTAASCHSVQCGHDRPRSPRRSPPLLAEQLRRDPARPLVTFYDDATGERVELSVTTYANWVAKTAGLLQDELDARARRHRAGRPAHALARPGLAGRRLVAWGSRVTDDRDAGRRGRPRGVRARRGGRARRRGRAVPVVALSLLPLGARFATALPAGCRRLRRRRAGASPTRSRPTTRPRATTCLAWTRPATRSQAALSTRAAEDAAVAGSGRLLTDVNPAAAPGSAPARAAARRRRHGLGARTPTRRGWARPARRRARDRRARRAGQPPRS